MNVRAWYERLTVAEPGRSHFANPAYSGGWYVGHLVSAWIWWGGAMDPPPAGVVVCQSIEP